MTNPNRDFFKWLSYFLFMWLCALLQGYAPLRVGDTRPQLLLILIVCVAVFEGAQGGGVFAFAAGFMADAMHPHTTAFFAVAYMLWGVLTGFSVASLFRRNLFASLMWAALGLSACTVSYWFFFQLMSGRGGIEALLAAGVPEIWVSLLFSPAIYLFVKFLHTRFSEAEEGNPWKERA